MRAWRRVLLNAAFAAALSLGGAAQTHAGEADGPPLPAPGSYRLDRIMHAPFGIVLERGYVPRMLPRYTTGAVTLLAFFYAHCGDPQGCPLAWDAFEKIRLASRSDPALRTGVRLVFLSFDPANDTPELVQFLAQNYPTDGAAPWHFLTTYSQAFLTPILRGFGQEIAPAPGKNGDVIYHLLKVVLLDRSGWVREIYAPSSLDPATIINDMKTLLMAQQG